jgi:hypothetical protein
MRTAGALILAVACGSSHAPGGDDGGSDMCTGPGPGSDFSVSTAADVVEAGPYVVATGVLPAGATAVTVNGSARGVHVDPARGVWSYVLAGSGDLTITAGTSTLTTHITVGTGSAPARDLAPSSHTVGSWMFSWFTGDTSWMCNSAWQPPAGFQTWDGSVAWARGQLLDQLDAHLDLIGLQLDSDDSSYRFTNVINVVSAARQLWEEGIAPPRVFPFLDTAIIADHWMTANGTTLDLSTDPGRAYLYGHAQAFYTAANTALGPFGAAAIARSLGAPYVGMWHSVTIDNESSAAVQDFKARFHADYGSDPYLVAHPNDWRNIPEVDEITLMFGPPQHFYSSGHDGGGAPTVNITAGFWNPISNTFYLPRAGGTNFDNAWASAQSIRSTAHHLYIDSWNETGEGSGIFEAMPVTYTSSDAGPCGMFANKHDESWGVSSRHYIDVTRAQAARWNDLGDYHATVLTHDLPVHMTVGEQRWTTVVMLNAGNTTWTDVGLVVTSFDTFGVSTPARPIGDVAHGYPGVIPVKLEAPCRAGNFTITLQMTHSGVPFGEMLPVTVIVD